jgi:hypothetical protein
MMWLPKPFFLRRKPLNSCRIIFNHNACWSPINNDELLLSLVEQKRSVKLFHHLMNGLAMAFPFVPLPLHETSLVSQ